MGAKTSYTSLSPSYHTKQNFKHFFLSQFFEPVLASPEGEGPVLGAVCRGEERAGALVSSGN